MDSAYKWEFRPHILQISLQYLVVSPDISPLDFMYRVRYQEAIHAKTVQHCRAEDCLTIDMEWFATVQW